MNVNTRAHLLSPNAFNLNERENERQKKQKWNKIKSNYDVNGLSEWACGLLSYDVRPNPGEYSSLCSMQVKEFVSDKCADSK